MCTLKHKSKKGSLNLADSDEDSEHELFYYANDRIKLMKEVLKLIKPKKIKSIAPDFMKNLDIDEINSILLEELLGISNKRLKHILNGDHVDTISTSSDSEHEEKPIDVISLDDISDTDDEFGLGSVISNNDNDKGNDKNKSKHKSNKKIKDVKKEKGEHSKIKESQSREKHNVESENDKLMNVLEILELQARARAIRSQLALENVNKKTKVEVIDDDDDDAVIVNSPRNDEIVITSSESDNDDNNKVETESNKTSNDNLTNSNSCKDNLDRSIDDGRNSINDDRSEKSHQFNIDNNISCNDDQEKKKLLNNSGSKNMKNSDSNTSLDNETKDCGDDKHQIPYKSDSDNDIINLDSEDIDNV